MASQSCPPILFLIFNRPELTRRVFERIREARPAQLFVAADAPRADHPNDVVLCANARAVLDGVDWPCELKTLFREQNLGCKYAVSSAITWFFEHVESGIILEDDCVPDLSFFRFAQDLLRRYSEDERIMSVSGGRRHGGTYRPACSYTFSRYVHVWGWATWRRAWGLYDLHMTGWPALRNTDWLLTVGDGDRDFAAHWTRVFDATHAGCIDTWDYQWTFSCWAQHGLSIQPACNLVTNIGFGDDATHTKNRNSRFSEFPSQPLPFPLSHPKCVARDYAADRWEDQNVFEIGQAEPAPVPLSRRILRGIPGLRTLVRRIRRVS